MTTALPSEPQAQQHKEEEEDPRTSSAALCLLFQQASSPPSCSFRPDFTHQSFSAEYIRGYQPYRSVLLQENQSHSSHVHHADPDTTHELQVNITLAPSCRTCRVDVTCQRKLEVTTRGPQEEKEETREAKRPRREDPPQISTTPDTKNSGTPGSKETPDTEESSSSASASSKDADFSLNEDNSSSSIDDPPNDKDEGTTRGRRMPVEEILTCLDRGLPPRVNSQELVETDFLTAPLGQQVARYQRNHQEFILCLCDGAAAAEYHHKVQGLALWFIETADNVDLASDGGEGGFWKVLYLFSVQGKQQYALAGYMTLFYFFSPFKKPKSGIVARVCQALLLPPYQRSGHGKRMLHAVFHHHACAGEEKEEIVEINVEDPAPGFCQLRSCVDLERFKASLLTSTPWLSCEYTVADPADPEFFKVLPEAAAVAAGAVGRVTPRQVQVVHELYKLELLQREEAYETKFCRMVKKRLIKAHREDLGGCRTKEEKQELLGTLYEETLAQYKLLVRK